MKKVTVAMVMKVLLLLFIAITTAITTASDVEGTPTLINDNNDNNENVEISMDKEDAGADSWIESDQYDGKKDSLFGNVYDMFRKSSLYQSFYNGQYIDTNELKKRLLDIEEDLIKVGRQYDELKDREKELLRFKKEDEARENGRNYVVEQLVDSELERLDSLEWRLSRIKKRLVQAKRLVKSKIDYSK